MSGPVECLGSFVRNGESVFVVQFWQDAERHVIDPRDLALGSGSLDREQACALLALLQVGERLELRYELLDGWVRCASVRALPTTGGAAAAGA